MCDAQKINANMTLLPLHGNDGAPYTAYLFTTVPLALPGIMHHVCA